MCQCFEAWICFKPVSLISANKLVWEEVCAVLWEEFEDDALEFHSVLLLEAT